MDLYAKRGVLRKKPFSFKKILTKPLKSLTQNEKECDWLVHDQSRLLTHYQPVVEIVFRQFMARGFFREEEKKELIQEVNLQLLEKKLASIRTHFKGSVLLKTYFSKVVYNSFQEIARRRRRQPDFVGEETLLHTADSQLSPIQQLAIRDEMYRLEGILKGFQRKRHKAEFNLKLYVRFLLRETDIQFYNSPKTAPSIELIRQHFFQAYDTLSDKEIYVIAVQLYNIIEQKNNDGDSLRRWIDGVSRRLIESLNGTPPVSAHTVESLKALLQLYFTAKRES